jgi:hypothetical protein
MADSLDRLDAHIARVERLSELARDAAPDVAYELQDELERQIGAGTDPAGKTWEPRKEDGARPLQTAAKALAVAPVLNTVFARLRGHVARHHLGRAKGGLVRQILPSKITPRISARIHGVLSRRFDETMGGR